MPAYQSASPGAVPASSRRNGTSVPATPAPENASGITVRVLPRTENGGPRARILVTLPDGLEVEVTRTMVAAIAHALWEKRGGEHLTNWLDAETVLNELTGLKHRAAPAKPRAGRTAVVKRNDDDDAPVSGVLLPRRARMRRL